MKTVRKLQILGGLASVSFCLMPTVLQAWSVNASEIYLQARKQNYQYLNLVKRYAHAIDVADMNGNTAYCYAVKYNDGNTQKVLLSYGANPRHQCVQNIAEEKKYQEEQRQQQAERYKHESVDEISDNKYVWLGVGALAVGGGIAALAGGGGGGSGSGTASGPDGNEPDKPDPKPEPVGPQERPAPKAFQTDEFKNSNYLEAINADKAYTYMYNQDSKGNLFSHQANSHEALKKIRAGVLDTGVYANDDLKGKIRGGYDLNAYNEKGTIRGLVKNNIEYYIFENEGQYYFMQVYEGADGQLYADNAIAGSDAEMQQIFDERRYGVSVDDFSYMNKGGKVNPGTMLSEIFIPITEDMSDSDKLDIMGIWLNIVQNLHHGTHVSGIIAANKNNKGNHGVAFENTEVVMGSWDLDHDIYDTVKKMVDVDKVSVINNSWGSEADAKSNASMADKLLVGDKDTIKAYVHLANNKGVWVHAAGNEAYEDAGLYAGIGGISAEKLEQFGYKKPGKYEVPFLSVVALDPSQKSENAVSGILAGFSNQCGSTSGYCIAAPGTDINSTGAVDKGTIESSGTSMAAPVVTGSISLLQGYYPWLNAQNISYILLETANKNGDYANEQVYGQGALDLEAAVKTPIGDLGLATTGSFDKVVSASASKVSLSGIMQNRMLKALPKKITAFDALNRPFDYDTEKMVNTTHASNANLRNEVARIALGNNKKITKDEVSGLSFTTSEATDKGGNANLATAEVVSESETGSARFYYAENSKYSGEDAVLTSDANPYLAMNEAYGAENMLKLSDTSKLKISLQTGENGLYERDYEQDKHSFKERSYAVSGEYSFNLTDYLELATVGGMLFENNALLGMNGTGVMGINDTATYYMGLKAAFNVTPNLSLMAAYYRGYTQGSESAMLAVSDLQTESFLLGGEYKLSAKDKVGVTLSSPLQVVKGNAGLNYAVGRDNNSDTVYVKHLKSSLKPEAKEYDMGVYYQGEPTEGLGVTGKVQARFNADGEKGLNDYIGIVGAQYSF